MVWSRREGGCYLERIDCDDIPGVKFLTLKAKLRGADGRERQESYMCFEQELISASYWKLSRDPVG